MTDENTGGAVDIYTGPDTGTEGTDSATEGEGWQMPAAPDGVLDFAGNPDHVAYAVDAMSYWDRDENGVLVDNTAEQLKSDWGSDMAANLAFSEAFGRAHPDILSVIYEAGMGDHPVVLRIAAMLGRRYAETSGDAGTITNSKGTATMDDDTFDATTESLMIEERGARGRGELAKAANLQKRIDALFKTRFSGPIVGSEGRNA